VGGFAISAFILSSISFVHTADARLTVPVALHRFSLCRHFGFSFRIHSSAAALSVTTFQLVRGSFGIGSAASHFFFRGWRRRQFSATSAASHSALVHLGAGRGITFGGGVVVHSGASRSSVSLALLRLMLPFLLPLASAATLASAFSCSANRSTY
jgi:hypothetical protein